MTARPKRSPPPATVVWLLLPLGLSTLVFYPITGNYFFGDDLYNLYRIVNGDLLTYLATPYGGHLLFVRNFVFYLCHQVFGVEPAGYFWLVLATHLLNVVLLFTLTRALTKSARLAAFGAALWGAAPLQEGTLGWYSVYGNAMVATLVLWLLHDLIGAAAGRPLSRLAVGRWCVLLLAASTCFGVGIGIVMAFPLIITLMHPPGRTRRVLVLATLGIAAAMPMLYFGLHRLLVPPQQSMQVRGFFSTSTLRASGRLLSALGNLFGYGTSSLLLGELAPREAFAGAAAYTALAAYGLLVAAAFVRGSAPLRRQLLACALLCGAAYGIVVAGRGIGWSKMFYLHTRYQYVALIPVALAGCLALAEIDRWRRVPPVVKQVLFAAWTIWALGAHVWMSPGIDQHLAARSTTDQAVSDLRQRIAGAPEGQDVYMPNQRFLGVGPMMVQRPQLFPGLAAVFTIFFPDNVIGGKRVFFVVAEAEVREAARTGRRTATLMVAPEQVPR